MGKERRDDLTPWSAQFPDDRPPVPPGVETCGEAAWEEYVACCRSVEARVEALRAQSARQMRTVLRRASMARASDAFVASELQVPAAACTPAVAAPARPVPPAAALDPETVMRLARQQGRVCPLPSAWRRLYMLLPAVHLEGRVLRAPLPVDSIEWPRTGDLARQWRLREQIDWADRHGALRTVHDFLARLREEEWHHLAVLRWPQLA
jgi:hypothetical protein